MPDLAVPPPPPGQAPVKTAPVKMTPARVDVPEGLSERWGWYRPPMAAPGRPQVRLAATSAAGRGLHELHLRKYTLKLQP